jgi:transposase-like protein
MAASAAAPAPPTSPFSASPGSPKKLFPLRKRTGTAAFHLSTKAVDFGSEDLESFTPRRAVMFVAELLWGSTTEMPCAHCGTIDKHYWSAKELRWKCKCCGKRFSVTSGTVFADHKLPLTKILKMVFAWTNGASGKPALQLRRDWHVSYLTAFTMMHKLREGLLRGFNTGVLCGVQEMDGMDVNGRRYREKRNRPQSGATPGKPAIPQELLKPKADPETGEIMGPPVPPKFGKTAKQPVDRRLLLVMRQRGVAKGTGAVATRVVIALSESSKTVMGLATRYASVESRIMSDEDTAYASFSRLFTEHATINHSKAYSAPGGVNNNQAESFNWRMRRSVEGIYLSPSNKYLADYAAESAWREDTRRMSTGNKLRHILKTALSVGPSLWWRGYTHGRHRAEELLIEGPQSAKGRGRREGWEPRVPR